ncbi:MAG: hypothetical protein JW763_08400 [candidate division Zixibacteria bacterium]|nr:hypothetical protein [candidate division Zixibacteria bacterium]
MKIRLTIAILCVLAVIGLCQNPAAQSLSTKVYPTVEEVYEAYLRGDIDYDTYLTLAEILETGVDSTDLYLLNEIPNVEYFLRLWQENATPMEREQAEPAMLDTAPAKRIAGPPHGCVRTKQTKIMDEDEADRSYYYVKSTLSEQWSVEGKLNREDDDRAEVVKRSLVYRARRGPLKKIIIGNYTARYGLGVSVGYRGRFLDKSEDVAGEDALFPVYGGFNGLYVEGKGRRDAVKWMIHYDQNQIHRLRVAAVDYVKRLERFNLEAIVLGGELDNRETDKSYKYYQLGACVRYASIVSDAAVEIAIPRYADNVVPAVLFEGSYAESPLRLRLSAWRYGDDYLNFTGGGRSGSQYHTVTIDSLGFEFRDRRNDQRGILLRGETRVSDRFTYDAAFSLYGRDRFAWYVSSLIGLEYALNDNTILRVDYRYERDADEPEIITDNEVRLEGRQTGKWYTIRSYLGYSRDRRSREYLSCFTRIRLHTDPLGSLETWLDLDKMNIQHGGVDYFYAYIREALPVTPYLDVGVKYSYRYSTSGERSTFYLDAEARW